jgi:ammonium transporter, Amt family
MNGCLTGLVGITAGCATVETWSAVVIGMIAGALYLVGSELLVKFRIDDAVDAIPVHMVGGAWGVIATGLFTKPALRELAFARPELAERPGGWFYNGDDGTLLGIQCLPVLFIFGWTFVVMGLFFYALNAMGMLRIDPLEEEVGMDISRHKGAAYDLHSNEEHAKAVEDLSQRRSTGGSSHHRAILVPSTNTKPDNNSGGDTEVIKEAAVAAMDESHA